MKKLLSAILLTFIGFSSYATTAKEFEEIERMNKMCETSGGVLQKVIDTLPNITVNIKLLKREAEFSLAVDKEIKKLEMQERSEERDCKINNLRDSNKNVAGHSTSETLGTYKLNEQLVKFVKKDPDEKHGDECARKFWWNGTSWERQIMVYNGANMPKLDNPEVIKLAKSELPKEKGTKEHPNSDYYKIDCNN